MLMLKLGNSELYELEIKKTYDKISYIQRMLDVGFSPLEISNILNKNILSIYLIIKKNKLKRGVN